jgi:hypothetical protein
MLSVATALALLAMATGDFSVMNPSPGEVRRGPLTASLTVSKSAEVKAEVILRVVLRNVSNQRASFFLERPGSEFFVKDKRGSLVHATVPCVQIGPCNAGLPELTTLEPGEQLEFVERWRPRGGWLAPGPYKVKAKVRAYEGRRTDGTGGVGSLVPLTLRTDILVRESR